jgi:hypothetical protein
MTSISRSAAVTPPQALSSDVTRSFAVRGANQQQSREQARKKNPTKLGPVTGAARSISAFDAYQLHGLLLEIFA